MATGPARALQRAVYRALSQSSELATALGVPVAGERVHDDVPEQHVRNGKTIAGPAFPYVVIGEDELNDDSHAQAAWEATLTIHIFSRPTGEGKRGKVEAKEIGDAIQLALSAPLTISGFVHTRDENDSDFLGARYFKEPDGLTVHGVLTFRALIDQQTT